MAEHLSSLVGLGYVSIEHSQSQPQRWAEESLHWNNLRIQSCRAIFVALQGLVAGALFRSINRENKYQKWWHDKKLAAISEPSTTKLHDITSAPILQTSKGTIREALKHQLRHIGENTWRFSLFKNGHFVAYLLSSVLWTGTIYIPFTFLPHRAKLMGISSRDSSLLISVIGISSIIGKVLFGVICDIPVIKPYRILLYGLSFITCGLALSLSFVASLVVQMTCAAVFGLFLGKSYLKLFFIV